MAHLDNKEAYKHNSSHEQLVSKHDGQITELQLRLQNLAIRLDAIELHLSGGKHL